MMTYEESLVYLENLCKFGINLGLARIENLLELMDHPERKYKTIHVTGTNGKGSTTAMLASILTAAGIKTGMYTSPHLSEYTERMMVDGQEASPEEFAEAIEYTSQFVKQIIAQGLDHPTEFEVLTAAAFHYFSTRKVEYAVIEVGLGGLLDSTNVIVPEVCVITNVTADHIDKCGTTITEIATHKAGIIKQGVPIITAAQGEGLEVITQTAQQKCAPLYVYGQDFSAKYLGLKEQRQKIVLSVNEDQMSESFLMNLVGYHQVDNGAVAIMAALTVGKHEARITMDTIQKGLLKAYWPGRFEIIPGQPTIIIDGAHNLDGATGLRKNLDEFYAGQEVVFLLGILRDKDVTGIVKTLIRPTDTVVVVAPLSERAGEPAMIAQEIIANHVEVANSIEEGIKRVRVLAGEDAVICIAGSLYLVGAARTLICK